MSKPTSAKKSNKNKVEIKDLKERIETMTEEYELILEDGQGGNAFILLEEILVLKAILDDLLEMNEL